MSIQHYLWPHPRKQREVKEVWSIRKHPFNGTLQKPTKTARKKLFKNPQKNPRTPPKTPLITPKKPPKKTQKNPQKTQIKQIKPEQIHQKKPPKNPQKTLKNPLKSPKKPKKTEKSENWGSTVRWLHCYALYSSNATAHMT